MLDNLRFLTRHTEQKLAIILRQQATSYGIAPLYSPGFEELEEVETITPIRSRSVNPSEGSLPQCLRTHSAGRSTSSFNSVTLCLSRNVEGDRKRSGSPDNDRDFLLCRRRSTSTPVHAGWQALLVGSRTFFVPCPRRIEHRLGFMLHCSNCRPFRTFKPYRATHKHQQDVRQDTGRP